MQNPGIKGVTFADSNLESYIRMLIDKPSGDIYLCEVSKIIELEAGDSNISDLTGIENLNSLKYLYLNNNNISDISAFSGLTSLQYLNLESNNISDLSPLVPNTGIDSGDQVTLFYNPLDAISINTYIPALEARGVSVIF